MTFPLYFLGVEETVKGVVGRFQIEQHLPHLTVIQLVWGRHAAECGQPGETQFKSPSEKSQHEK